MDLMDKDAHYGRDGQYERRLESTKCMVLCVSIQSISVHSVHSGSQNEVSTLNKNSKNTTVTQANNLLLQ